MSAVFSRKCFQMSHSVKLMSFFVCFQQQVLNEENLRKQEESVQKQEAMRKGKDFVTVTLGSC